MPDLREDRCTHVEKHNLDHNNVYNCRYKNKKDCVDNTLNQPETCFWTTPILHWKETECKNSDFAGLQLFKLEDDKLAKKDWCLSKCVHTKGCNQFEHKADSGTGGSCRLYKSVTFDERCTNKTSKGWTMYTRAGYRYPDETLSKCTHRDLYN